MAAVKGIARLLVPAGVAKPTPAIGQALGPLAVNMMEFCKQFNDRTKELQTEVPIKVRLTAFEDRTFQFDVVGPPSTWFLKRVTGVAKGSSMPGKVESGTVTARAIYEVARAQQALDPYLAVLPLESVAKSLVGTAASMGLRVVP